MNEDEIIKKMVVEITTCSDRKSDTNNFVELYIGSHEWALDIPHVDDFKRGKTDTFNLDIPDDGLYSSDFRFLCFKKSAHSGKDDDWCIQKVKVIINDKVVYEKDNIHAWLKNNTQTWCAPGFNYGKAGD